MPDFQNRKISPAKSEAAAKKLRDSKGHFIKKDLINLNDQNSDDTVVDIKIKNPLQKIIKILQDLKRRQAAVVDFKFTVPLVAIPLFMLLAFSMGKTADISCSKGIQTKIGVVFTLKSQTESINQSSFTKINNFLHDTINPIIPNLIPYIENKTNRTILIQRDNTALTITSKKLNLTSLQSRQVFATGLLDSCSQTINIEEPDDIQLVP